jgi:hypothetical protein
MVGTGELEEGLRKLVAATTAERSVDELLV